MYCSRCGGVVDGHDYCPQCGNPVRRSSQPVTTPQNRINQPQGNPVKVLVFGILGLALSGLIGLIFSIIALSKGNKYIATYGDISKQVRIGRRLAIAGIIVGTIVIVFYAILIILMVNNTEVRNAVLDAFEHPGTNYKI